MELVKCDEHGERNAAFVCQHLNLKEKAGFHEPFDSDPRVEYPNGELNAWCNKCNELLDEEGGWTEEAENRASVKLVCDRCFFRIKNLNRRKFILGRFLDFIKGI